MHIDGSLHSGSGTILRYGAALATLIGEPLHMTQIRARRDKPGLRPQHLEALRACCFLASGTLEGDEVGSQEIRYYPGKISRRSDFLWDIGTAGSATMMAYTLLPLMIIANSPCSYTITGGLFQDHAPTATHMQQVLFPLLERMGASVELEIERPGYVPKGGGRIRIEIGKTKGTLEGIRMLSQGKVEEIGGISLASHLRAEKVSERMAGKSRRLLAQFGYEAHVNTIEDDSAVQRGAALLLWAKTDTGCILGADQAGKQGRRSEAIAENVVKSLMSDVRSGATVDRFLADQLILFAALAGGSTEYLIPAMTDHVESNLWLVKDILGCKCEIQENHLKIDGIGFQV